MPSAEDIARYIIWLASQEEEPDVLTPLRLQKLLYYVQGWSLAGRDRAAFPESVQAWSRGPVVPEVYQSFKEFGGNAIPSEQGRSEGLLPQDEEFVREVWEAYKPYSSFSLMQMTHAEAPWRDARGSAADDVRTNQVITHDAMRSYFRSLSRRESA